MRMREATAVCYVASGLLPTSGVKPESAAHVQDWFVNSAGMKSGTGATHSPGSIAWLPCIAENVTKKHDASNGK